MDNTWEKIHSSRSWGRWPNIEVVKFMGKHYFGLDKDRRKKIRVLDIGLGQGSNTWFLIKEGFDVRGFDIAPSAVNKLKDRLIEEHCLVEHFDDKFKVADIRSIPFDDATFDAAIDSFAISCLSYSDHKTAFRELSRVMKKGGLFFSWHILKGSFGDDCGKMIDKDTVDEAAEGPFKGQGTVYFADYDDLVSLLKENGFSVIEKEHLTRTYEKMTRAEKYSILVARKNG